MSVRTELAQYLPVTLELIVLAMVISLVLAIPGGVFTAYRAGDRWTRSPRLTFVLIGIPSFRDGASSHLTSSPSSSTSSRHRDGCR